MAAWCSRQVGRQAVAGCNPFTIQLATPALFNGHGHSSASKVTAEDLKGAQSCIYAEVAVHCSLQRAEP